MHEHSDRDGSNPPTERELHAYLASNHEPPTNWRDQPCTCGGTGPAHFMSDTHEPVDPDATVTALPDCCRDRAAANARIDALRARVKRLKDACETLGKIVHDQAEMALDASGRHDLIDETGDGDWELVWGELAELRPRLEAAQTRAETNDHILQQLITLAATTCGTIRPAQILAIIYGAPGAKP